MRCTTGSMFRLMIAAALCVGVSAGAFGADGAARSDAKTKFMEAVDRFNAGDLDRAASLLDEVIALTPKSEDAWQLREAVGAEQLSRLLLNPTLAPRARKIWSQAAEKDQHLRRDAQTLRKFTDDLASDDVMTRWTAIRELTSSGPFAVPYLLDLAAAAETPSLVSKSVGARMVLDAIRRAAVPPIAAALPYAPKDVAVFAASFLEKYPDARALPALLAVAEDAQRPELLRKTAASAAAKIRSTAPVGGFVAACLALAERYYYADLELVETVPVRDRVIWSWNAQGKTLPEQLTFKDVPTYAYPRLLCHGLLVMGLSRNQDGAFLELYASNALLYMEEAAAASDPVAAELQATPTLVKLAGAKAIAASLKRAVKDQNTLLARRCIEALGAMQDARPAQIGDALVQALAFKDPFVRVAAAEVLLRLSPAGALGGADQAVENIVTGLGGAARATVGIMSEDLDQSKKLAQVATSLYAAVRTYRSSREALAAAKQPATEMDLLILDVRSAAKEARALLKGLRDDVRTAALPVIFVAKAEDVMALQKELSGATVISESVEAAAAQGVIGQALAAKAASASNDIRKETELLTRTLKTVAALPRATAYPIGRLAKPVAAVTQGYPEEIRLLALDALAVTADKGLRDHCFTLYAAPAEPAAVRASAGKVFLALLQADPELRPEQRATLRGLLADANRAVVELAAAALGMANAPAAERDALLLEAGAKIPALR